DGTSVTLEGVTDTLSSENEKYASALLDGQSAFLEAQSIYDHPDFYQRRGWKKEHETRDGFAVYSRPTNRGRMFTISEELDAKASEIMHEMWKTTEEGNAPIFSTRLLAKLSDNADILKMGSRTSGREMNVVRIYRQLPMSGTGSGFIAAFRSVDLPDQPISSDSLMPALHLAAIRLRPDPIKSGHTFREWIVV
ncbi:hypothetical protein PENTCL1PPCAC_16674, partial [Pristionchus entomophagus]